MSAKEGRGEGVDPLSENVAENWLFLQCLKSPGISEETGQKTSPFYQMSAKESEGRGVQGLWTSAQSEGF